MLHSTSDCGTGGHPITNLTWSDANHRDARIVLVAAVDTVVQITEISSDKRAPEFVDQSLVARDGRLAGDAGPVCAGSVNEGEVDIRVCLNFVEFIGCIVGEKLENEARRGVSLV